MMVGIDMVEQPDYRFSENELCSKFDKKVGSLVWAPNPSFSKVTIAYMCRQPSVKDFFKFSFNVWIKWLSQPTIVYIMRNRLMKFLGYILLYYIEITQTLLLMKHA